MLGRRRQGRGPTLWLSSLLACSECGSNYVQYGRTDYVCSGFHNGSTCSNGIRFRIADIEREVLAALELDLLSPAAIQHATNLAMEDFDKQRKAEPEAAPALSTALAEIDKRESEVREQFKSGKLPASVFKSWIGEFTKEREALNRPPVSEVPPRVSRSEFIRAYRSAVERERESKRHHSSFQERMRAAPDVQQCYDLAGEWDYLAVVVARSMAHCQAILGELFLDAPNVKRFDTLFVFGTVKRGLDIPMRQSERSR